MKQLLTLCSFLLTAGLIFVGCEEPSSPSAPEQFRMGNSHGGNGTPAANPVWTFSSRTSSKGKTSPSIAVSDIDGGNRSHVYLSPVSSNRPLFSTWSPDGGSISLVDMPALVANGWYAGTVWGSYSLKVVDVAVTNGVVVSSNLRTLFSTTRDDSMKILAQAWCPSTSTGGAGKIAFLAATPRESRIYLISADGSDDPSLIYSTTVTEQRIGGGSVTWSGDGTELAFAQGSGTSTPEADRVSEIRIIDLSGNVQRTLLSGYASIGELQWSNGDLDQITFEGHPTSKSASDLGKYKVSSVANSSPTLLVANDGGGYGMYWSPDNTKLVYNSITNQNSYIYNVSDGAKTQVGAVPSGDWR